MFLLFHRNCLLLKSFLCSGQMARCRLRIYLAHIIGFFLIFNRDQISTARFIQ